jgi:hypothetical protein
MRDALNRQFDVVLAESLDRCRHHQENTADPFERLALAASALSRWAEQNIAGRHIDS